MTGKKSGNTHFGLSKRLMNCWGPLCFLMRAQRSGSQWVSLALLRSRGGAATNSLTKAVAVTAFSTSPFSTYITPATSRNCSDEGRKEMGMTLKGIFVLGTKRPLSTRGGSMLACREQQVDMSWESPFQKNLSKVVLSHEWGCDGKKVWVYKTEHLCYTS